jgi:predicted Rossmann-fold nucleotide-binding protein
MITAPDYKEVEHIGHYLEEVPFNVSRRTLYSADELYDGYDPKNDETRESCYDSVVYKHFLSNGKRADSAQEALARSLHDHSIMVALECFLAEHDQRLNIGIMGGHALSRTDKLFRQITLLSKRLTELGFMMISGGGPGAMEATHLGAWMAGRSIEEVDDAINMLSIAPSISNDKWLNSAMLIIEKYPQTQYESLAIPTWLYGHEPSTPFATHIAKLFENSIREDGILTIAYGGIVYTPGSAGTMQEIFQDAVQNHYLSFGFSSPMVFLDKHFWTEEMPVYPFLKQMMETGRYKNLILSISDNSEDIIAELVKFRDEKNNTKP